MSEADGKAEQAALEDLGYSQEWLRSGILDRQLLAEQHERFRGGGSRRIAKYRSEALGTWLSGSGPIDEAQLEACLSLIGADPDAKLGQTALAALIQSPRISLKQLERIAQSDPKVMRRHEPLIRRTYLTRRLDAGVTDELLAQVIEFQEAAIQTALIRDARLSRKQAELLAKRGANPTIRKQAQAWFQDRKSWK
ncbi:MAG: hypothetical protein E4H11_01670 [Myxococcales bacterium]|nr:MAG: hypothetical protein E4H11_01670 [Myxococcales bacterium]